MLTGIDPVLTGELLAHLDAMGHSDGVVLADAHFPASRLSSRLLVLPGVSAPRVLRAVRTVVPADARLPLDLMSTENDEQLAVQEELVEAAAVDEGLVRHLSRDEFHEAADEAHLVVRTGELRTYSNAILRKGVVGSSGGQ